MVSALLPAVIKYGQKQLFRHLPDVVLRGQHTVDVLVHGHPAIALQIAGGGIKGSGGLSQLGNEVGIRQIGGHHGRSVEAHVPMIARKLPPLLGVLLLGSALAAGAQQAPTTQRLAGQCPLVVPPTQSELQPLRIKPSQVATKNAIGCLSAADAVYGPDGCPLRLCGQNSGVIQLPEP